MVQIPSAIDAVLDNPSYIVPTALSLLSPGSTFASTHGLLLKILCRLQDIYIEHKESRRLCVHLAIMSVLCMAREMYYAEVMRGMRRYMVQKPKMTPEFASGTYSSLRRLFCCCF